MTPAEHEPHEPDGLRIPPWVAGPLLVAAIAAGASGLVIAQVTASKVEGIAQEAATEQKQAQDLRERVARIETKIEAVEEKIDDQKAVLEEIRMEVKKP